MLSGPADPSNVIRATSEALAALRRTVSQLNSALEAQTRLSRGAQDSWSGRYRADFDRDLARWMRDTHALLNDTNHAMRLLQQAHDDAVNHPAATPRPAPGPP